MTCPNCDSDSALTLSSQASGTVTVRRRQCKACNAEWLAKVTEEVIQGTLVLAKPNQPCAEPSSPEQIPIAAQTSDLDLFPDLTSGLSKQDLSKTECDEPAILTFPVSGKAKEWRFCESDRARLAGAFPALDVTGEARKALAWVQASSRNRKTADGMGRFLFNWLSRSQNNGRAPGAAGLPAPSAPKHVGLCIFHYTPLNSRKPARQHDPACSECRHVAAMRNPRPPSEPTPTGGLT